MKRLVLVLVLLGLGAAIGALVHQRLLARERAAAAGSLRLHGNIDLRDAQLAFFGQERIAALFAEEGDRVTAGQLLAKLHTERLDAQIAAAEARVRAQQALVDELQNGARAEEIAQARAALSAAEVRVTNAEQLLARVDATAGRGASSQQALDDARAALAVARAERDAQHEALALALAGPRQEEKARAAATLDALRADVLLLRRQLADCELFAPAAGVVQTRILEVGEMAAPERPAFTLALTDPKWARVFVPEPDLGRVRNGMSATVRSDSLGGTTYPGRVGFVSPVAEFTPKTVETEELRTQLVYEVRVLVDDPRDELRLGMPVTVDVETGSDAPADRRSAPENGK